MEDTDLRGMSLEEAKEYILAFLTTLKTGEKELAVLNEDIALWESRVQLARDNSEAGLEEAARSRLTGLQNRKELLEAERTELGAKIARMREQLPIIKASERTVDADLLLAQLQMMTGEALEGASPPIEEGFANMNADAELDALKQKLSGEKEPDA